MNVQILATGFHSSVEKLPNPIALETQTNNMTCLQAFSQALHQLHAITWSFNWFTVICVLSD